MPVFDHIRELLAANGVQYDLREHPAVYTSQEAAAARGCELKQGAKSLVCHVKMPAATPTHSPSHREGEKEGVGRRFYVLAVTAADRQTDLSKLRDYLGAKKIALCSPEEVLKVTGCTVGSVPPFGNLLGLPTYVDPSLAENDIIAFNPGSHIHSILMRYDDYVRLAQPEVVEFAKPEMS